MTWTGTDPWVGTAAWGPHSTTTATNVTVLAVLGDREYTATLTSDKGDPVAGQTMQRESTELVGPIQASLIDGGVTSALSTSSYTVAIAPDGVRPTAWAAPTIFGGKAFILASGLTPGPHRVWLKYVSSPETVVVPVGTVYVQ